MTPQHTQPEPTQAIRLQRLHPLSPVLRSVRLFAITVAAISWRGYEQLGFRNWSIVVAALLVVVLAYSAIAWRFSGYEVVGRELRIHEGVLSRRVRAVPLERLQAIEVVQPLLARPAALAELRLDVAGAKKSEAPLAFLPLAEATRLRARLLALAGGEQDAPAESSTVEHSSIEEHGGEEHGGAESSPVRSDSTVHSGAESGAAEHREPDRFQVDNRQVLLSQFLTPPVMFTPLAVLYIVSQVVFNSNHGLFAIASMITAVAGTIGAPAMRVLNFWNFRLGTSPDPRSPDGYRLRVRHGLLETRSQTVHPRRIQSLTVTWPLLWRPKGWLLVTMAVAGQSSGGPEQSRAETDRLLPVADFDTARGLVPLVIPRLDLADLPLTPVPPQARWLAPIRHGVLAAGFTPTVFATVDGRLTRTLTLVPYARIQSVRVRQGPLQRRLGLATLSVDLAGAGAAVAPYRSVAQAHAWADELTSRARAARTPPAVPLG